MLAFTDACLYMQLLGGQDGCNLVHAVWSADLTAVQGCVQPPVHPKIPLSPHAVGAAAVGAAAGGLQGDVGTASGLGGLPAGGLL